MKLAGFVWLSNIDGSSESGGIHTLVGDSSLRAAVALRVEVTKGRWGVIGELQRTGISADASPDDADVRAWDLDVGHAEVAALFRLGGGPGDSEVDALAGLRVVRHRMNLELTGDRLRESGARWVEPFVGFRFGAGIGGPFRFGTRGNIGGVVVGSRFTWIVESELGIRLRPHVELIGRYRYSEAEFEDANVYVWDDGQVQGWYFGIGADL